MYVRVELIGRLFIFGNMPQATCPARILVIDDEEDVLVAARLFLKRHFASVETLREPSGLLELVRQHAFDVLLLDMNFTPGMDDGSEGLHQLSQVLKIDPHAVVVLFTAYALIDLAVQAMKEGAADFVSKPWENERLLQTLTAAYNLRCSRAERRPSIRGRAVARLSDGEMIGTSDACLRVLDTIRRAAPTLANVLILGENGTGKELAARELHRRSPRAEEVFLRVDLGALSPQLFEAELFGHRRGAFTDAREARIGLFRAATGGTLFLDEIGNIPLHLQSKLLSALERREVMPVGSERAESIDVRLICATNLPPERLADQNVLRQDLLYRMRTVEIVLPPLRERSEDIPLLLDHFIAVYSDKYNIPVKRISDGALEELLRYAWPGNVRELQHSVERAVILSDGEVLHLRDFSIATHVTDRADNARSATSSLDMIQRDAIANVLKTHKGNITRAAQALGLTRASLYRRMQKYGL